MSIKVNVEQWCIDEGKPNTSMSCPIALAIDNEVNALETSAEPGWLEREQKVNVPVHVFRTIAVIGRKRYKLPTHASLFVYQFDSGKQVSPFVFELTWRDRINGFVGFVNRVLKRFNK